MGYSRQACAENRNALQPSATSPSICHPEPVYCVNQRLWALYSSAILSSFQDLYSSVIPNSFRDLIPSDR